MISIPRLFIIPRLWMRRRTRTQMLPRALGFGLSLALHTLIALYLIYVARVSLPPSEVVPALLAELVQEELPTVQPSMGDAISRPAESARPEVPAKGKSATVATETAPSTLGALLAMVERAHRPQPIRSQREHETANVVADIGGGKHDVERGSLGNKALEDFIRAQIERRWQVDASRLGDREIIVSLRLLLSADGSVEVVEIVDQATHWDDFLFRLVAIAGRNAALLSSPLQLPPGLPQADMEITLDLNTKQASR